MVIAGSLLRSSRTFREVSGSSTILGFSANSTNVPSKSVRRSTEEAETIRSFSISHASMKSDTGFAPDEMQHDPEVVEEVAGDEMVAPHGQVSAGSHFPGPSGVFKEVPQP